MSRFTYVALRGTGERVTGVLRSPNRHEAMGKLVELDCHPISVEEESHQPLSVREWLGKIFGRVRQTDLAVFTRQLAALLKAGLPMVNALKTLRNQTGRKGLQRVLEDLEQGLTSEALTLAQAMAQHPRVFNPVYRGLVHSGEEGGRLTQVLEQLAKHLARSAKLRGQVAGAFIYPAVLVLMGITAVFVLMAFVIPKFEKLFASFGQELPWITRLLLTISGFLAQWWWVALLAVFASGWIAFAALRTQSTRQKIDAGLLRLPVIGPMILKLEVARIARTLGALLNGGVRIVQALDITSQTVQNRIIRNTFTPITQAVSTGDSLGDALERTRVFPPLAINLVQTGEDTGELEKMLDELAEIYEDESERAVTGAVKLLEPLLIVVMGLIIAGIVAAVMLPIFQSSAIAT